MQKKRNFQKNNRPHIVANRKNLGTFVATKPHAGMSRNRDLYRTVLLWLFCAACSLAYADKRIYVLADTHVMGPSLLDRSDNKAWQADLAGYKTMQELSVPIFDTFVEQIIADKPDLLLMVGDLTKDGETESHRYVRDKLTEIQAAGIGVYVIPGNHDRWWNEGARKYAGNTYTAASYFSDARFAATYHDCGYGGNSERHGASLTYATRPYPGLTLIGADTRQTAQMDENTVQWICQKSREAKARGDQPLLMMHHSLIPHFHGQEEFYEQSVVKDNERMRDLFMSAGIKVVLTGHYHVSDIAGYTNASGQEILDICTGSPIAYPCDYRVLTFDDTFTQLRVTTRSLTGAGIREDFPEYAKDRLDASVRNWAAGWIGQRMGGEGAAEIMSQSLANVFVIHAEGNEPANPASSEAVKIYDDIQLLAPLFDQDTANMMLGVSTSMKSILGDYQDPSHADNVVNDRELTIALPTTPTAIDGLHGERTSNPQAWYTLQGIRLQDEPTRPGIYIHGGRITRR